MFETCTILVFYMLVLVYHYIYIENKLILVIIQKIGCSKLNVINLLSRYGCKIYIHICIIYVVLKKIVILNLKFVLILLAINFLIYIMKVNSPNYLFLFPKKKEKKKLNLFYRVVFVTGVGIVRGYSVVSLYVLFYKKCFTSFESL